MTIEACAELVFRGDPDRFRVAMAAPLAARERLFPLYAFNLELARTPWAASDPMVARMRLQFWREALLEIDEGKAPRAHEVVTPLARVMRETGVPGALLDRMVVARWADVDREPFEAAALQAYLGETAGVLMQASAAALGEGAGAQVQQVGTAAGLAAMLLAAPELGARGWQVLPQSGLEGLIATARTALADARGAEFGAAVPALRAAWRAEGILRRAQATPDAITQGGLEAAPVVDRVSLAWKCLTGRW